MNYFSELIRKGALKQCGIEITSYEEIGRFDLNKISLAEIDKLIDACKTEADLYKLPYVDRLCDDEIVILKVGVNIYVQHYDSNELWTDPYVIKCFRL